MSARNITAFTLAILAASAAAFAAPAKIDFMADAVAPAASGNPLSLTGTTAGVGWTLTAQGTDFFNVPTNSGSYVYYTHNTASVGEARGATYDLVLSKAVYGLTFRLQDFGTRAINYGPNSSNVSGGEQTYTVDAFNGANPIDLSVANGDAQSLIALSDLGNQLKATSGVFDSQGTNIVGFIRDVTYTIPGPTTHVVITTLDKALTTAILGDNVNLGNVGWPEVQVPEPTTLATLSLAGLLVRRSRRRA
jgi:hypothetical protein